MKVEACIFDLDGVIVDTARFHYVAWKRIAQLFGGDLSLEQNEKLKGVSRMGSLEYILKANNIQKSHEEKSELAKLKNEWYLELISSIDQSELLPGVINLLTELKSLKIPLALGSASRNAIKILHKIGVDHLFHTMIDGNLVEKSKPDPEVFLKGAKSLGIKPANCIVFEDSSKGIEAAISGGFIPVGIGEDSNLKNATIIYSGFQNLTFDTILTDIAKAKSRTP